MMQGVNWKLMYNVQISTRYEELNWNFFVVGVSLAVVIAKLEDFHQGL
jgi:hypothetical protein